MWCSQGINIWSTANLTSSSSLGSYFCTENPHTLWEEDHYLNEGEIKSYLRIEFLFSCGKMWHLIFVIMHILLGWAYYQYFTLTPAPSHPCQWRVPSGVSRHVRVPPSTFLACLKLIESQTTLWLWKILCCTIRFSPEASKLDGSNYQIEIYVSGCFQIWTSSLAYLLQIGSDHFLDSFNTKGEKIIHATEGINISGTTTPNVINMTDEKLVRDAREAMTQQGKTDIRLSMSAAGPTKFVSSLSALYQKWTKFIIKDASFKRDFSESSSFPTWPRSACSRMGLQKWPILQDRHARLLKFRFLMLAWFWKTAEIFAFSPAHDNQL